MYALRRGSSSIHLVRSARASQILPTLANGSLRAIGSPSRPSPLPSTSANSTFPHAVHGQVAHFCLSLRNHDSRQPQNEIPAITKFSELGEQKLVHQTIVDTMTRDMKLDTMTEVQSLTIDRALKGHDTYVNVPRLGAAI